MTNLLDAVAIHEACRAGDMESLRAALGHAPEFPNCPGPRGTCQNLLEYAIYWSPTEFIRRLLELGANANYAEHGGFPSLIAILSTDRTDRRELLELLLAHGADLAQRGLNDWTPLHYAVSRNDCEAVRFLLDHGADPRARMRIDDRTTPLEDAERLGRREIVHMLHAGRSPTQ